MACDVEGNRCDEVEEIGDEDGSGLSMFLPSC